MEFAGTVALVGVGLIGGSIWCSRNARKLASEVIGVGRDQATLEQACRLGAIDRGTTDMADGVADAQVVVVCTPVSRVAEDVRRVAELAPSHTLVTDAGQHQAADYRGRGTTPTGSATVFVRSAHPLAGSEQRGRRIARADLFDGRVCVLTPTPGANSTRADQAGTHVLGFVGMPGRRRWGPRSMMKC